jgi:hypothetical protein
MWLFQSTTGVTPNFAGSPQSGGRSGNYAAVLPIKTSPVVTLRCDLSVLGTQTAKKLYVGFGLQNLSTGYAPDTGANRGARRFVTFLNAAGVSVITIDAAVEQGSDLMHLYIGQGSTTFAKYPLTSIAATVSKQTGTNYKGLAVDDWTYVEFMIDMVNNQFALHVEGTPQFLIGTSDELATYATTISDIKYVQFSGNGPSTGDNSVRETAVDDFYLADDNGSDLNTWIGPCRIFNVLPNYDYFLTSDEVWSNYGSAYSNLASNDGDNNFVTAAAINKKQLLSLSPKWANGTYSNISLTEDEYVAAVQINAVLRKTNFDGSVKPIYKSAPSTYTDLGPSKVVSSLTYGTKVFVSESNPVTNANWTLADITDSNQSTAPYTGFGIQIADPPPLP